MTRKREEYIELLMEVCNKFNYIILNFPEKITMETKLDVITKEKYIFRSTVGRIFLIEENKNKPSLFFKNNPYTEYNIKQYLINNNYDDYELVDMPENSKAITNLTFYCKKHKTYFKTSWNGIQQNRRYACSKCFGENISNVKSLTYNDVKEYIESLGCELLSEEYTRDKV